MLLYSYYQVKEQVNMKVMLQFLHLIIIGKLQDLNTKLILISLIFNFILLQLSKFLLICKDNQFIFKIFYLEFDFLLIQDSKE